MSLLENALSLAEQGFHVFPLRPNTKIPAFKNWQSEATTDPVRIKAWWTRKNYNIGLSTSKFNGSNQALAVLDLDEKNGKSGTKELLKLKEQGFTFPKTRIQETPSGGKHLVYKTARPLKQGTDVLGPGIDIRSRGGYVVGAGSVLNNKKYRMMETPEIANLPDWIYEKLLPKELRVTRTTLTEEPKSAETRAIDYLKTTEFVSVEGAGGDETAFRVACTLKDMGVEEVHATDLMASHWNERCSPPWDVSELELKVKNAYQYGKLPYGFDAPEAQFDEVKKDEKNLHPFSELNKDFAFVTIGGGAQIIWETKDVDGIEKTEYLSIPAFHQKFSSWKMDCGQSTKPVTQLWMSSKERRSYDGICFLPGKKAPSRFYNLWKGFSNCEKPKLITPKATQSLDMLLEHVYENICGANDALNSWILSWCAHLIQKPWEKPLVALVFQGSKGVGKSSVIGHIGALMKSHYTVTSNRRYLFSNFNAHLENCLLFVLEEAFWSGDKQAEGILKDLITGKDHLIERKGKESYTIANRTRIVIIGNEDWVAPASYDERRYAVFQVGEKLKQNRHYFRTIQEGMQDGGYHLLFNYLNDYDLSKVDINQAPETEGLLEQKISTLPPFYQFWFECLDNGALVFSDFEGWPEEIVCDDFRIAFTRYCNDRKIYSRIPDMRSIGRMLKSCVGDIRMKKRFQDTFKWVYRLPDIETCKKKWATFLGHPPAEELRH